METRKETKSPFPTQIIPTPHKKKKLNYYLRTISNPRPQRGFENSFQPAIDTPRLEPHQLRYCPKRKDVQLVCLRTPFIIACISFINLLQPMSNFLTPSYAISLSFELFFLCIVISLHSLAFLCMVISNLPSQSGPY